MLKSIVVLCRRLVWIADVKKQCGLPVNVAWNRQGEGRVYPCPDEKVECIKNALKFFGMISG